MDVVIPQEVASPTKTDGQEQLNEDDEEEDLDGCNEERNHMNQLFAEELENEDDINIDFDAMKNDERGNIDVLEIVEVLSSFQSWSWRMSKAERENEFERLLFHLGIAMKELIFIAELYVDEARRTKSEANAMALKQASIIGGTIVGAAKRLVALRAAEPFAIIVEEACEVMEPTLVSVLAVSSVEKLELIGDQRQLPAFIQQCWYNSEVSNPSIKKSLFERLVETEDGPGVSKQCTLLDVQRRMRTSISNLTKSHYKDVVTIIDHPKTASQKVGDRIIHPSSHFKMCKSQWSTNGRLVPGIQSSIFFWNMKDNKESKPKAGLSACNENEALATVSLMKYLLLCEIPPSCITILTPYQGQKRELLSIIRKERIFKRDDEQVLISTVDRYQGDENDIIILSLVRTRPGNRFVNLLNRFIVASSRARLGFFIIGSVEAVVEGFSEANGHSLPLKGPSHWKDFIYHLQQVQNQLPQSQLMDEEEEEEDDTDGGIPTAKASSHSLLDDIYCSSRISQFLPICCPQHRNSKTLISSMKEERKFPTEATGWNRQLCNAPCSARLRCSHACGLPCHFYNITNHNKECEIQLDRPCSFHETIPLFCKDLSFSMGSSLDTALQHFECKINVLLHYKECEHDITLPCHQNRMILDGLANLPDCQVIVNDFIHPKCGHIFPKPTCSLNQRYMKSPPLCQEVVKKRRFSCTHSVKGQCSKIDEKLLSDCMESINTPRPRCGHPLSIKCCKASILKEEWNGTTGEFIEHLRDVAIKNDIYEDSHYGPEEKDLFSFSGLSWSATRETIPSCEVSVNFHRSCGHIISDMKCSVAFSRANQTASSSRPPLSPCKETVIACCKLCQNEIKIPCCQKSDYGHWNPFELYPFALPQPQQQQGKESIIVFKENRLQLLPMRKEDMGLWKLLSSRCKHRGTLVRSCNPSHFIAIDCENIIEKVLLKNKALKDCVERIPRLLSCSHSVMVECYKSGENPPPKCHVKPTEPYIFPDCGHALMIETCSKLQQMKKERNILCEVPVEAKLPNCGHRITVRCSLKDKAEMIEIEGERAEAAASSLSDSEEGSMLLVQEDIIYCQPCSDPLIPSCSKKVCFKRSCSHILSSVVCDNAFKWSSKQLQSPPCVEKKEFFHPVCDHVVETECWVIDQVSEWQPWRDHPKPLKRKILQVDGIKEIISSSSLFTPLPPPISLNPTLLSCKVDVLLRFGKCQHLKAFPCSYLFSHIQELTCQEMIKETCEKEGCGKIHEFSCFDYNRLSKEERQSSCNNLVLKICQLCQVNNVTVPCSCSLVNCNREVIVKLPCGHEGKWKCGNEEDIRYYHNKVTNKNSSCIICNIDLWNRISDQEYELPAIQSYCYSKFLSLFPSSFQENATENVIYQQLPYLLDNHEKARTTTIRRLIQTFREKKCVSFPPPVILPADEIKDSLSSLQEEEYFNDFFDENYEFIFLSMDFNKNPNLEEIGKRRFAADRQTLYGLGLQVKKLTKDAIYSLPASDGKVKILVGLGFRCQRLTDTPPFSTNITDPKQTKQAHQTRAKYLSEGYDCVEITSPSLAADLPNAVTEDVKDLAEYIFWQPGVTIPLAIFEVKLHTTCGICMESCPFDPKLGAICSENHFVCWDCFDSYITQASKPEAIHSYVNQEGHLNCPTCSSMKGNNNNAEQGNKDISYDILRIGSVAPSNIGNRLLKLKVDNQTTKERESTRKELGEKFHQELERLQKMSELDREVHLLRFKITEEFFNLRCPRCKSVFIDFDGCFALTCGNKHCDCHFCAWCLADCGTDAHPHVVRCPLSQTPGDPHGDVKLLNVVHKKQRELKVNSLMENKTPDVKRKLKEIMKKDFTDLQLEITF
jgi:hypothetical protein